MILTLAPIVHFLEVEEEVFLFATKNIAEEYEHHGDLEVTTPTTLIAFTNVCFDFVAIRHCGEFSDL